MFKNKKLADLYERWSEFKDQINEYDTADAYQSLMVKTWPLLIEAWNKNEDVVDKDIVRLLSLLGNAFTGISDSYSIAPDWAEVTADFHVSLLNSLLFHDDTMIDEEGNLVVDGFLGGYVVDPTTFELPIDE